MNVIWLVGFCKVNNHIIKFRKFLEENKALYTIISSQKEDLENKLSTLKELGKSLIEAQEILNAAGVLAQSQFQEVVEKLVTEALQYVFGENYSFELDNQIFRNQPETHMFVVKDGVRRSLEDELGGGVLDIISFALRIIFWAIQVEKTEPIFILDEPLKFVSRDKMMLVGKMLKSFSDMLGLQIIMVSHEYDLIDIADRSFLVTLSKGISHVEMLK